MVIIKKLLQNQDRVGKFIQVDPTKAMREFRDANQDSDSDYLLELTFKTKANDIESYHDELLAEIMKIGGAKEKLHKHEMKALSPRRGRVRLLLRVNPDEATSDPSHPTGLLI